jgi:hypothetical protein
LLRERDEVSGGERKLKSDWVEVAVVMMLGEGR